MRFSHEANERLKQTSNIIQIPADSNGWITREPTILWLLGSEKISVCFRPDRNKQLKLNIIKSLHNRQLRFLFSLFALEEFPFHAVTPRLSRSRAFRICFLSIGQTIDADSWWN